MDQGQQPRPLPASDEFSSVQVLSSPKKDPPAAALLVLGWPPRSSQTSDLNPALAPPLALRSPYQPLYLHGCHPLPFEPCRPCRVPPPCHQNHRRYDVGQCWGWSRSCSPPVSLESSPDPGLLGIRIQCCGHDVPTWGSLYPSGPRVVRHAEMGRGRARSRAREFAALGLHRAHANPDASQGSAASYFGRGG